MSIRSSFLYEMEMKNSVGQPDARTRIRRWLRDEQFKGKTAREHFDSKVNLIDSDSDECWRQADPRYDVTFCFFEERNAQDESEYNDTHILSQCKSRRS